MHACRSSGCASSKSIQNLRIVHACMQELGLRIIEVNPGSERSGASMLHSIGEATQSARLPASAEALLLVR